MTVEIHNAHVTIYTSSLPRQKRREGDIYDRHAAAFAAGVLLLRALWKTSRNAEVCSAEDELRDALGITSADIKIEEGRS